MSTTFDSASALAPSGNLRRRRRVNRLVEASATGAAVLAVAVLAIVLYSVAQKGASQLSFSFITKDLPASLISLAPPGVKTPPTGIANALLGTGLIVALATAIALPLGVLIAIFLTEYASPRTAGPIRLALDLINGLPTIVIAVFIYGLIVLAWSESGFAAAVALAIIMLPLIARTTQEMLLLVPQSHRDGAAALGVSRWRTMLGIVLPASLGGILTGTILAIARAAGETAPVLIVCSLYSPNHTSLDVFGQSLPTIPLVIYQNSGAGTPDDTARAWGAAFVLMLLILVASLGARMLLARSRRKMLR